jgi:dTDP-4-dehydrorhamnose 3,5-epimerase
VQELRLAGLKLVQPRVFADERGFFLETYSEERYREAGVDVRFVQDNHSQSVKGTVRGLHFQTTPGQAKLVRCGSGRIFDVAVDIRPGSPTFGQWEGVELDSTSHAQLFVPVGFAHGFCVLSERAEVLYKVSSPYAGATESGFRWDDPDVGVRWPVQDALVSARDKAAQSFRALAESLGVAIAPGGAHR